MSKKSIPFTAAMAMWSASDAALSGSVVARKIRSPRARRSGNPENGKFVNELETCLRGVGVAATDLVQYELRNMQVETVAMPIPPLACNLLMCKAHNVAAGASSEIADDVAVEVRRWRHARTLPQVRALTEVPSPRRSARTVLSKRFPSSGQGARVGPRGPRRHGGTTLERMKAADRSGCSPEYGRRISPSEELVSRHA